jgi:hypothetical protein
MPMRRSPASRSTRPDASATTRVTIEATDRHVVRSSSATTDPGACAASHAQVSSKSRVNRDLGDRAHGTAATTTPSTRQDTRGASASSTTGTVPKSSPRHRRRPSPRS